MVKSVKMKRLKLMKISEIILACMFAIIPSINTSPLNHNYCKSDSDCHEANFYCYESRECVQCTKCSFYNRLENPAIKCAKNKDECGECSLGMEAETNFDGTFTCNPSVTTIPNNNNNTPLNISPKNSNLILYLGIPLIILVLISCLALIIKFKICLLIKRLIPGTNCPNNNLTTSYTNNNPPPPYSEKSPSAPPEEDPLIARRLLVEDDNQRANPFHHPNYVNGGSFNNPYRETTTPIMPTTPEAPTTPILSPEDENTQPSPWSPNSQSTDLNQPTNFSNILSTPELTPHQPENSSHEDQNGPRIPPLSVINICINTSNTQVIN